MKEKKYVKSGFHSILNNGHLSDVEVANLSDFEPEESLNKTNDSETEKLYQINLDYLLREIGGEYVIIPVGEECTINNAVMTPNHSAVFIWKAFQEPSTEEDVVQKALQEYEASLEIIRNDVHRFVEDSLSRGILREVD